MRIAAHGISVDAGDGWEARVFQRSAGAAVLHVASFALAGHDGDFGAAATGRMGAEDVFLSLIEYRVDARVRPGIGLFAARPERLQLRAADFDRNQLQVTRARHLGCQRFFTASLRPFCLFAVIEPQRTRPERLVKRLNTVLATLRVAPAAEET